MPKRASAHFRTNPVDAIDDALLQLNSQLRALSAELMHMSKQKLVLKVIPGEVMTHAQLIRTGGQTKECHLPWLIQIQRRDTLDDLFQIDIEVHGPARADARHGVTRDQESLLTYHQASYGTMFAAVEASLLTKLTEEELTALKAYRAGNPEAGPKPATA